MHWYYAVVSTAMLIAANTTPLIKFARPQQSKADSDQVSAEVPLMSTCGSEHCWHKAERMLPGWTGRNPAVSL